MSVNLDVGLSDSRANNLYGMAYRLSGHITYERSVSLPKTILTQYSLYLEISMILIRCTFSSTRPESA